MITSQETETETGIETETETGTETETETTQETGTGTGMEMRGLKGIPDLVMSNKLLQPHQS